MHKVKLRHFEGPLDLLLKLIEDNKLDITDVTLSEVTEQYLNILHKDSENISADELADFLVVASKLLVLKSKVLLPYLFDQEEDEEDLAAQLKIYREFYEATRKIQRMIGQKHFSLSRQKLFVVTAVGFHPPRRVSAQKLKSVFLAIIEDIKPFVSLPERLITKTINITEKIQKIREMIAREVSVNFLRILSEAKDKTEVIVSFLALLELTKQQAVSISQDRLFADIYVSQIHN